MISNSEILIIDDMPDQITTFSNILRNEGFRVYATTSGTAIRKFFQDHIPSLILLDMQVGDLSGLEIFKKVKASPKLKDVPIIFITSETSPEGIAAGFELGASDCIKKPFFKDEFLSRIKAQLNVAAQRKELIAANEELNQFTLAVTHDLKAPFNVVNMLINLLGEELGSQISVKAQEIINLINQETSKVKLMIERLFEFSKMWDITPKKTKVNVKAIVNEIYDSLILLEPKDRDNTFKCGNLPKIIADENLVRMAIKNLLQNALKYSSKKEKTVIEVFSSLNKSYYVITVKDNGAGFDMRYAGKIFQVFERLHTDAEFKGTGVGLALVDRIMRRHNGKIVAYGEVDKGAEMTLYFPKDLKDFRK